MCKTPSNRWIVFLFITLTHYVASENATHDSHIRYINDEEIMRIRTKARECEDSIATKKQKLASAIDAKICAYRCASESANQSRELSDDHGNEKISRNLSSKFKIQQPVITIRASTPANTRSVIEARVRRSTSQQIAFNVCWPTRLLCRHYVRQRTIKAADHARCQWSRRPRRSRRETRARYTCRQLAMALPCRTL